MKLATLDDGSRDGQLIVVSRDLASAHLASHIAGTLRQVLDDWNFLSPQLEDLSAVLNGGKARHAFAFDPRACLAPLPRACLWAPHGAGLARSDHFLRPVGVVRLAGAMASGPLACRVQAVAITGDVAASADAEGALDGVRLLLLAATWQADGTVGASAFSPVTATPEELGPAWAAGRLTLAPVLRRQGDLWPLSDSPDTAPGFGPRLAAWGQAGGFGVRSGSLVGGPGFDAGPDWGAGQRLQLHWRGPDGHSAFGSIDLLLASADAEVQADPAPEAPVQDPAAR
jgi:fumarylacetoacetate (FAA) hydrolase